VQRRGETEKQKESSHRGLVKDLDHFFEKSEGASHSQCIGQPSATSCSCVSECVLASCAARAQSEGHSKGQRIKSVGFLH